MTPMTPISTLIANPGAATTARRPCLACRAEFDAAPLQGICDTCAKDEPEKRARTPKNAKLDGSWPSRAKSEVDLVSTSVLADKARSLLPYVLGSGTVAIVGDRGRGKTVLATWLAHQRTLAGKPGGQYTRAHDLFARIRRAWHPASKDDEWVVLDRFRSVPFLVIDEFQERSESDWENRTLVNILDHRHGEFRPTVLIANLTSEEFSKQAGPSLISRLTQTGGIVECEWSNLRT